LQGLAILNEVLPAFLSIDQYKTEAELKSFPSVTLQMGKFAKHLDKLRADADKKYAVWQTAEAEMVDVIEQQIATHRICPPVPARSCFGDPGDSA